MIKTQCFKISGMHCTSCAMNIDGELEDTPGVKSANTNYAKSQTNVKYDPDKVTDKDLSAAIRRAGYEAIPLEV
jgi:copper chaperone CopZ